MARGVCYVGETYNGDVDRHMFYRIGLNENDGTANSRL